MKKVILAYLFCLLFCVSIFSQESQKIDEFGSLGCDDYLSRTDAAIYESQKSLTSTIYFLIYEGKELSYGKFRNPVFGSAKAKIRSMKQYIERTRGLSIDSFRFVEAGFRKQMAVEVWSVPLGATVPKPTPTLERVKFRKGNAKGFCTYF